jgi:phosphotransferase system enzyme I (PtsI)
VKQRIRDLDAAAAAERVRMIMDHTDPGRIAALLDDFNDLIPTTFESGVGRFG